MKFILFVLILCSVSWISANEGLNSQLNQPANNAANVYNSTSYLQGLAYQQHKHVHNGAIVDRHNGIATNNSNEISHRQGGSYQHLRPHFHDTAITRLQADSANNKSDRVNQPNRSRLQGNKNQLQRRSQNITVTQRKDYPIDNREVHPRFRSLVQTGKNKLTRSPLSKISNSNIQANRLLLADGRSILNTTKSLALLRILTTKASGQTRKRFSFAEQYYQQRLRAFFKHNHEQMTPHAHSNVKTGLKRRK